MTTKRKQELLDNFIHSVNGRGPATDGRGTCRYVMEGHPGCAIGCQPELEPFKHRMAPVEDSVDYLLRKFPAIGEALCGAERGWEDISYLQALQRLHDFEGNWSEDGKILHLAVERFCAQHGLRVPESEHGYA